MTDYTKTTNFTAKDALTTGDPNKVIKGSEFDTEFDNIETNFATKQDSATAATLTGSETLTNKTLTTPTLTLKQGAAPTPTAEGDIQWDTDDNKIKVGDSSGTKTFSDDSYVVGQQTISIQADGCVATGTNGAATYSRELATNDVMISGYAFDAATNEKIQIGFIMPKGQNLSTIIAQFVWTDADTAGSGDVIWGCRAIAVGDNDAMDTSWGTAQTVTDTFLASGDNQTTSETAAITASGTPAAEDKWILEFYRDAAAGGDTYTQDAVLTDIKIHYTTSSPTDD